MNWRKNGLIALGFLIGCGTANDDPANVDTAKDETSPIAAIDQRLRVLGFREPRDVQDRVVALRAAADTGDRQALVDTIHYPFTTYRKGRAVRQYATPSEVRSDYEAIFTKRVLDALRAARYEELFVRDQGAMIGNGEVWLSEYNDGIRIKAINSDR